MSPDLIKLKKMQSTSFYIGLTVIFFESLSFATGSHKLAFTVLAIFSALQIRNKWVADKQYIEMAELQQQTMEELGNVRN